MYARALEEDPAATSYSLGVAFDADGAPLLAWSERDGIHVRRLEP